MELHVSVRIHIKVDTGMSRIGFFYQQPERDEGSLGEMEKACRLPGLVPEGIFTHFAVADEGEEGEVYTRRQFENFREAIRCLEERGISFSIRHCANSASIGEYPEFQLDMVRPGIILYGLMPSGNCESLCESQACDDVEKCDFPGKTDTDPGTAVTHGCTYRAEKPLVIRTIPAGYATATAGRFPAGPASLWEGSGLPFWGAYAWTSDGR